MRYENGKAYVLRLMHWWWLMSDLARSGDMNGAVYLYDIDY